MSVGLLLRQSPPHFALDICFGWAQKSIFLRYLEYACASVCVCVCVEDFYVVCFYPPVYYTHTFTFKDLCPIQVCLSRLFAPSLSPQSCWPLSGVATHCYINIMQLQLPALRGWTPCAYMPTCLSFSVR